MDPEELTAVGAPAHGELPPDTRMGAVHLTVADLDRSLGYYETQIGLRVHARDDGQARLGTGGEDLLVLTEEAGARPADGYSGLFHFALLVPERVDLARWLAHAARNRVQLSGMSDHFVSEAIYLRDPDHHGIEIYADRPRELWEGQVERLTTLPLDTNDLLATLEDPLAEPFDGLAAGTVMGHVHLCVADVAESVDYYRDVMGFGLMVQLGDQAAFLSAGGYHHHLGGNTWQSAGRPYAPEGHARLTQMTIVLPDEASRAAVARRVGGTEVRDPSGIPIVLSFSYAA
ncbi:MAG TPA: VOC family protein [Gaiellaceae bacterium]|jgi:catechol 2,3-dioxygenase|nr:VOC family protein [Gaiellaceae bacterium]